MIPKTIHQIWIQGEEFIPENLVQNKDKIKQLHPQWKYILWDEVKILELLKRNKKWIKTYYKFDYLHQKVDYAKLIILYTHGGICIDMDAYTIKNLDDLVNKYSDYDLIVSYIRNVGVVGNYIMCKDVNSCMNNGNFFGKPNTDILQYMIEHITTHCSYLLKEYCILHTTGPFFSIESFVNTWMKTDHPK